MDGGEAVDDHLRDHEAEVMALSRQQKVQHQESQDNPEDEGIGLRQHEGIVARHRAKKKTPPPRGRRDHCHLIIR